MCLILFAVDPNDRDRLIIAANRDELYARPTTTADFWTDQSDVLAGRDQQMSGTWLGVNRSGRFAAVTNFMETPPEPLPPRSRGELPADFLVDNPEPHQYLMRVASACHEYRGFNLIVADPRGCWYFGNRAGTQRRLEPGTYGLSNQILDCNWPKVSDGRQRLTELVSSGISSNEMVEALFNLLLHKGDERDFSNSFIAAETYGTRATTVVTIKNNDEVYFEERNFGANGNPLERNVFNFRIER